MWPNRFTLYTIIKTSLFKKFKQYLNKFITEKALHLNKICSNVNYMEKGNTWLYGPLKQISIITIKNPYSNQNTSISLVCWIQWGLLIFLIEKIAYWLNYRLIDWLIDWSINWCRSCLPMERTWARLTSRGTARCTGQRGRDMLTSSGTVSTVQYSTVKYSTVQYSTVQYSTVQYSTVQYSTVKYNKV